MSIEIKHRFTGATLFTSNTAIDLAGAVKEAVKSGVNLSGAYLSGENLSGANLSGAYLSRADLSRADLSRADMGGADLSGADMGGANLGRANLSRVNLGGANRIYSFGPIGEEKRIGYAVAYDGGAMVKLGCFWGTEPEALARIIVKYGVDSDYAAQVALACKIVMAGFASSSKTEAA